MPNFAERTLLVYKVLFNRRGDADDPVYVDDVDGLAADDLFFKFCEKYRNDLIELRTGSRFVRISKCNRIDGGVLAKLYSGVAGEAFDVVEIESARTLQRYDEGKAPFVESRCYFTAGYGRNNAFLCVEHVAHGAGDTVLFEPFGRYLREVVPRVTMKRSPVIISKAVESFLSVESVEVKLYLGNDDVADARVREGDYVSYKLGHKRARPFNLGVLDSLRKLGRRSPVLYGFEGTVFDSERSAIYVNLKENGGGIRRFLVGEDLGMPFKEVLNERGEPPLDDDQFVEKCEQACEELSDIMGRVL